MPYVLTANHCLEGLDAMGDSDAGRWVFYWEYEHPGCVNGTEPVHRTSTGAVLVANNQISDFALLKINAPQDPRTRPGVWPYYLGWDRSGNAESFGVVIHHPVGDVKKISLSSSIQNQSSSYTFGKVSFPANSLWKIAYASGNGTTEGGSSGSPFINSSYRVIGQLLGGGSG